MLLSLAWDGGDLGWSQLRALALSERCYRNREDPCMRRVTKGDLSRDFDLQFVVCSSLAVPVVMIYE